RRPLDEAGAARRRAARRGRNRGSQAVGEQAVRLRHFRLQGVQRCGAGRARRDDADHRQAAMMYWEDVAIGMRRELGHHTFSEEEIVRFAKMYDPQPFHIDPEAARSSLFGGIIASGWHTAAIWMKLALADRKPSGSASPLMRAGVSPGYEDMRWLKPVRPGTRLAYSSEVCGKVEL